MFNHNRGLWGYTGTASDGEPLTIMSHGMGGPSAAIVLEELCDLGLELVVRVGTCGALVDGLALGDLIAVTGRDPRRRDEPALGAREPLAGRSAADRAARRGGGARRPGRLDRPLLRPRPGAPGGRGARPARSRSRWRRRPSSRSPRGAACARPACSPSRTRSPGAGERIDAEHLEAASLRLGREALAALLAG